MTTLHPPFWRGWPHHLAQAFLAIGVVMGLSMSVLFVFMMGFTVCDPCPGREERARFDIKSIEAALKLYRQKKGRYPSTSEGIQTLVSLQVLEQVPLDPWGDEYHYALWKNVPRLWSYGADGFPGGDGADSDIYNLSLLPPWLLENDEPPEVPTPALLSSPLRCWTSLEPDGQCGV